MEWFENLMGGLPEELAHKYVKIRKATADMENTESSIVKAADKIEALLWAYEEYSLGNEQVRRARIVEDILSKLEKIKLPTVMALVSETRKKVNTAQFDRPLE
jgi:5'-deoxynucleotidase YfbR-like HD superfamily hydrolase